MLTATTGLAGTALTRVLVREGVLLAEVEQWRLALARRESIRDKLRARKAYS